MGNLLTAHPPSETKVAMVDLWMTPSNTLRDLLSTLKPTMDIPEETEPATPSQVSPRLRVSLMLRPRAPPLLRLLLLRDQSLLPLMPLDSLSNSTSEESSSTSAELPSITVFSLLV